MIKNRLGILVPDTPVMRAIYPRLPNELPWPSPNYESKVVEFSAANLQLGDVIVYDKATGKLGLVHADDVAEVLPTINGTRYETNGDTYVGTVDGVAHFVARDDAYTQTGMYQNDTAATSSYYRIEIDNTAAGSITFSATSGNASIASTTIEWEAGDDMDDIVALFTAKNASYLTFAALADGSGVGLEAGGYGANTMTVTASTKCTVIDCSALAMLASANSGAAVGGTYDPDEEYTLLAANTHHSFRGATAQTILGSSLIGADSVCLGNSGQNYSYLTGANFAKFKAWASTNGDSSLITDGVNGSTNNSAGHCMKKATFEANIISTATGDALLMYEYYNHLLTDTSGDYAELRATYEEQYGDMDDLYDAYLMSHMMQLDAESGIVSDMRGYGPDQTAAKADCLNVDYDYKFIPAYPPEYNANLYGDADGEVFTPGSYYHPEPVDIGLMFRDDIMANINANIAAMGEGTALTNGMYRGSCADYYANDTWYFSGNGGCFLYGHRFSGGFRSRPVLALSLS